MQFKNSITALVAVAGLGLTQGSAQAATIFFDSFETPYTSSWGVFQDNVGDNGSWSSVEGTGIEIQHNGVISGVLAHTGEQYVELDSDLSRGGVAAGSTNSMMSTNINFREGEVYEISFAYRPRTNNCDDDNGIELLVGNLTGNTFNVADVLASISTRRSQQDDWEIVTVVMTALADMNAIAFRAFGNDNTLGGFIDSVHVEGSPIPLPGAAVLLATGLGAFGSVRGRKKASA